jgi:tRNA(adenine34) deaminase
MTKHEKYMKAALEEAAFCEETGDVPIGAVIVRDEVIIARGRNRIEAVGDPTAHAEIEAIRSAVAATGYQRLIDCSIYVTLEPCAMCSGAIVLARLPLLVYGAADPKTGASGSLFSITTDERLNHRCEVINGVLEEECSMIIKDFFRELRNSKKR